MPRDIEIVSGPRPFVHRERLDRATPTRARRVPTPSSIDEVDHEPGIYNTKVSRKAIQAKRVNNPYLYENVSRGSDFTIVDHETIVGSDNLRRILRNDTPRKDRIAFPKLQCQDMTEVVRYRLLEQERRLGGRYDDSWFRTNFVRAFISLELVSSTFLSVTIILGILSQYAQIPIYDESSSEVCFTTVPNSVSSP